MGFGADASTRKKHDLKKGEEEEKLKSSRRISIILATVTEDHSYYHLDLGVWLVSVCCIILSLSVLDGAFGIGLRVWLLVGPSA